MTKYHIYIRHGPRLNLNLDPPLKEDSTEIIRQKSMYLSQKFGLPQQIITSPYLRTRQTAQIITKTFDPPVSIAADVRLSEKIAVRKRTGLPPPGPYDAGSLLYGALPNITETEGQVTQRVYDHLQQMSSVDENMWFITHGYILEELARIYKIKLPFYPPYLGAVAISHVDYSDNKFNVVVSYPKRDYVIVPKK